MTLHSPTEKSNQPLITLDGVTLRIRDRHVLKSTHWMIEKGQSWAVLGPNGSGKSTLIQAIAGKVPVVGGSILRHDPMAHPDAIGYVSFELQHQIIANEQSKDDARYFSGKLDNHLTVRHFMETSGENEEHVSPAAKQIFSLLGLARLMDRPIRSLSNGEMRKVLISRAVLKTRGLLILDEPFDGLDSHAGKALKIAINALIRSRYQILLVTHRVDEILPEITHVICLKDCGVVFAGPRTQAMIPEKLKRLYDREPGKNSRQTTDVSRSIDTGDSVFPVVIQVRNASVTYGDQIIFQHLNWCVRKGENWAITGPTGSGKTTLLQMVSGDHPQAYANEIYLFGQRRGSGESVQEIKQHIGRCSAEFQVNYRKPIQGFEVVLSGFFDSIGLYRQASQHQRNLADVWLERLNMSHLREKRFDHLSYGERRAILLARAMVKSPEILVLDEPCQGLDPFSREMILALLEDICNKSDTQLLVVTHLLTEVPKCITHILDMKTGNVTASSSGSGI